MLQGLASIKAADLARRMATKMLPKVKDLVMDQIKSQAVDLQPMRNALPPQAF